MKKRLLSLASALAVCLSLSVPVFAAPISIKTPTGDMTITLSDVISEESGKAFGDPCKIYVVPVGSTLSAAGDMETIRHWYMPAWQTSKNEYEYDDGSFYPIPSEGLKLDGSLKTSLGVDECNMLYVEAGKEKETTFLVKFVDDASPAAPGVSGGFTDVAANSPYKDAIAWAVDKGITNGTSSSSFSPNNTCTIRQILTFLYRAAGRPGATAGQSDTNAALGWAVSQDIAGEGVDLDPDIPCSRERAVSFIWRAAGMPEPTKIASFSDVHPEIYVTESPVKAISWAVEKGITNGTGPDTFSPSSSCTRGQIVTFLHRAYKV